MNVSSVQPLIFQWSFHFYKVFYKSINKVTVKKDFLIFDTKETNVKNLKNH